MDVKYQISPQALMHSPVFHSFINFLFAEESHYTRLKAQDLQQQFVSILTYLSIDQFILHSFILLFTYLLIYVSSISLPTDVSTANLDDESAQKVINIMCHGH